MRYPLYRGLMLPLLLLTLFLGACGSSNSAGNATSTSQTSSTPVTLKIFAAASLTESLNEMKTKYRTAHPGVTLVFNFAGSQALVQQLTNGASADVFASADQANMKKAQDAGVVTDRQIFARNKLVVIVPANNPGQVHTLKDLARKGLKLVVAAPSVPVGKYGQQVLDKLGKDPNYGTVYANAVKGNEVSQEDNVKAVVQKVQLGEADAGIVYLTDVTALIQSKVSEIEIPDRYNVIAEYPVAVVKNSAHAKEAETFVRYILSPEGQDVLQKYHFIRAS